MHKREVKPINLRSLFRKIKFSRAILRDFLIRRLLRDNFSLAVSQRRDKDYLSSRCMGEEVFRCVRAHTGFSLDERMSILDVGCGDGRVAAAFARHNHQLNYIGIDVNPYWVKALKYKFKNTNFKFIHINVFSDFYAKIGEIKADKFRFPFEDEQFDLIIANAIFDHLYPEETYNYLCNMKRVLHKKGRIWAAFIILRDEDKPDSLSYARWDYRYEIGDGYRTISEKLPTESIAYPIDKVMQMIRDSGLELEKIIYGWWRNTRTAHCDLNQHGLDVLLLQRS